LELVRTCWRRRTPMSHNMAAGPCRKFMNGKCLT